MYRWKYSDGEQSKSVADIMLRACSTKQKTSNAAFGQIRFTRYYSQIFFRVREVLTYNNISIEGDSNLAYKQNEF